MPERDVELVRRALAASTAQPADFEAVNALYDPEHVLTSDWGVERREYRGARGFAEAIADLDAAWQEWHKRSRTFSMPAMGGSSCWSASRRVEGRAALLWISPGRCSSRCVRPG